MAIIRGPLPAKPIRPFSLCSKPKPNPIGNLFPGPHLDARLIQFAAWSCGRRPFTASVGALGRGHNFWNVLTCIRLLCWFTGCCGFVTNLFCSLLMWFSFFWPTFIRQPQPQPAAGWPSMCGLNLPKSFISSHLVLHLFDLLNLHMYFWHFGGGEEEPRGAPGEQFRPSH